MMIEIYNSESWQCISHSPIQLNSIKRFSPEKNNNPTRTITQFELEWIMHQEIVHLSYALVILGALARNHAQRSDSNLKRKSGPEFNKC